MENHLYPALQSPGILEIHLLQQFVVEIGIGHIKGVFVPSHQIQQGIIMAKDIVPNGITRLVVNFLGENREG